MSWGISCAFPCMRPRELLHGGSLINVMSNTSPGGPERLGDFADGVAWLEWLPEKPRAGFKWNPGSRTPSNEEETTVLKANNTLRGWILFAALLLTAQTLGCAGTKKEARYPEQPPEGIEVRCPYCKTVLKW